MFRYVPPAELSAVWETVSQGLHNVLRRTQEKWNHADIHRALVSAQAQLFVHEHGFLILQQSREEWSCLPFVNVWVMWFAPGKGKVVRLDAVAWLDELTHRNWKFNSPRLGWMRGMEDVMEIERVIYRRKQ